MKFVGLVPFKYPKDNWSCAAIISAGFTVAEKTEKNATSSFWRFLADVCGQLQASQSPLEVTGLQ